MKNVDGIGRVLPIEPYASYESQCFSCRNSAHPTKLYFVQNGPYQKTVHANDYNVFYINLSHDEDICGLLTSPTHEMHEFISHPGQIVTIVPAGNEITYKVSSTYKQAVLCVHRDILNEKLSLMTKGKYNKALVRSSGPVNSPLLCSVLQEIEMVQTGNMAKDQLYLESLYDMAISKILNHYTDRQKDVPSFKMHSPAHMKKVLDYIYGNLDQDIKVSDLADIIGLSQYHFTRVFKEYLGVSPYQYILNLRFEKSKEYLETTDMSLISIASTLGFSSQSHFQSFFKKQTGQTPHEYRQGHL